MAEMAQIRVGKPQARPDTPSHVKGVPQGNHKGAYEQSVGHKSDGSADARRSTGISPGKHNAILPIMPNISPA
jgi:hypothetical protein